jgi:glycerate 2-kinase
VELREGAAGNLPDDAATSTAEEILLGVKAAREGELVILLISGGGSALLPLPAVGVSCQHHTSVDG